MRRKTYGQAAKPLHPFRCGKKTYGKRGAWLFDIRHEGMPPILIAGPEYAADFTAERNTFQRVSLNTLMSKLEAFADVAKPDWQHTMSMALWSILSSCRGQSVPLLRLRQAIRPHSRERRYGDHPASLRTLHVAMWHCRRDHPGEQITNVFNESYRLEKQA